MGDFSAKLQRIFGVGLQINRINVTENKAEKSDLKVQTLRRIQDWVYMDLELYQRVLEMLSREPSEEQ
jgi:hypothetical protein